MNQIKFCHNWNNKLNNDVFTTIRKYSNEKWNFYHKLFDQDFEILLNGNKVGVAILQVMDSIKFQDISHTILRLDTGEIVYSKIEDIFKKFRLKKFDDKMIILTFQRKKEQ